ncbi:purpurin isoform X2 [Tachyglossus aculeatus]|uniref:purpurin isoform X2 n=1 Tax=Tachyglossus aculeatus TaxID=9261 RepID=UPI0018F5066D|nr:purpurin isoform X2 [Tachyglossus aculeatus]
MKYTQYVFLVGLLSIAAPGAAQSCTVDSLPVKDNFDPKRYTGKWYALAKRNPQGLFLQDNISAEYTIKEDGTMSALSKGRVKLFGFWVICADMAAQYTVPDPTTPAKMYMTYQGLASYLSSGVPKGSPQLFSTLFARSRMRSVCRANFSQCCSQEPAKENTASSLGHFWSKKAHRIVIVVCLTQ